MIIEELIEPDMIKRYSDKNVFILQQQTGIKYGEAIDLRTSPYTYIETNEPIEPVEEPEEEPIEE